MQHTSCNTDVAVLTAESKEDAAVETGVVKTTLGEEVLQHGCGEEQGFSLGLVDVSISVQQ